MVGNSFLCSWNIGKVDNTLIIFLGILYGLIRSAAFVLNTANHKVKSVDHISVAYLNSSLRVRCFGLRTYLDFIVVIEVFFHCHEIQLSYMAETE